MRDAAFLRRLAMLVAAATVVVACQGGTPPTAPAASAAPSAAPSVAPTSAATEAPSEPASEAPSAEAAFPVTVTDAAGKAFTFDEAPVIGCLWTGCDEGLAALGLVPAASTATWGAGRPYYFPLGDPATMVADWSDAEQWATAGVDIIIVGGADTSWTEPIQQAGEVLALHQPPGPNSPDGVAAWKANQELLGKLTGLGADATADNERFDAFVASLKALAPADAADNEIAILFSSDDGSYYITETSNPFCDAISSNGLGTCVAPEGAAGQANAEAFLELDPQWIAYQAPEGVTHETRDDPVWGQLTAVKEGRVFDTGDYACCSTRNLMFALQDYAFNTWGADSGVPDPGPVFDFDPTTSPFYQQ